MAVVWSKSQSAKLARLWMSGATAAAIAPQVGLRSAGEVARKIVLLKIKRAPTYAQPGLKMGGQSLKPAPVVARKTATPEPKPVMRNGKPITIATIRDRECRWTHGDAGAASPMCANRATHGTYCQHHAERSYVPEVRRAR